MWIRGGWKWKCHEGEVNSEVNEETRKHERTDTRKLLARREDACLTVLFSLSLTG